jgi:hypothetical protein
VLPASRRFLSPLAAKWQRNSSEGSVNFLVYQWFSGFPSAGGSNVPLAKVVLNE